MVPRGLNKPAEWPQKATDFTGIVANDECCDFQSAGLTSSVDCQLFEKCQNARILDRNLEIE